MAETTGDRASDGGGAGAAGAGWRARLQAWVEHPTVRNTITGLIIVNAITLGLETSDTAMAVAGDVLVTFDRLIVAVFVIEVIAKIVAYGRRFPRDPWNIFDFLVVAISVMPATGEFSVLRALRVLRVLRLVSIVPSMRRVVQALLSAIPGMGSIVLLLSLIYYVAAVMATKLFGSAFPDWFGTIGASMYSLFQIMTLESWSMGIVRPVMEVYPYAWAFFVPFILLTTFAVLNLFIAIVVNAMESEHRKDREAEEAERADAQAEQQRRLDEELAAVKTELRALRGLLETDDADKQRTRRE
jgi:voltage-gated sodium channel